MPYECEFDSMCGREFKTMDERDAHERNDHEWIETTEDDSETVMPCGIHIQETEQCDSCYECPCFCECS